MEAMGIDSILDFETLKNIIVPELTNFMIPTELVELNEERLIIELLSCPFPSYGTLLFGVKIGDLSFLNVVLEVGGKADTVKAFVDKTICLGDGRCAFRFEKIQP